MILLSLETVQRILTMVWLNTKVFYFGINCIISHDFKFKLAFVDG